MHDGLEARPADTVDRLGRDFDRHARLERCLARDVHARAGLQHAAEDHVADVRSLDGRPGNRFTDDNGAEIGRGQILEHAAERSDRRSARTENERIGIFGHFLYLPGLKRPGLLAVIQRSQAWKR